MTERARVAGEHRDAKRGKPLPPDGRAVGKSRPRVKSCYRRFRVQVFWGGWRGKAHWWTLSTYETLKQAEQALDSYGHNWIGRTGDMRIQERED